jgi:glyoxylase-like metal-dependent hydrolase (beta-lactamase superfamily II)
MNGLADFLGESGLWLRQVLSLRTQLVALLAVLAFASVLLMALGWHLVGKNSSFHPARVPRLDRAAMAVVPGVYLLGRLSPSAAYVIETSQGLVLVDSSLDDDDALLKSQMAELGLEWTRVCAILLTRPHGDHTDGAEALRTGTGARIYAGEGDASILRAGQPRFARFSNVFMLDHQTHPTTVDVVLRGDEEIAFGDVRIHALATPGHTPGSMCYLLERNNLRFLFAGDVIMMLQGDEKPRTELGKPLGTYSAYLAPRYHGDAEDSLASLRRLRALPYPTSYCLATRVPTACRRVPASVKSAGSRCSIRAFVI